MFYINKEIKAVLGMLNLLCYFMAVIYLPAQQVENTQSILCFQCISFFFFVNLKMHLRFTIPKDGRKN